MGIKCHSERILNPFRGVMNVISTGDADAVTIDGVHWDIYIHDTFFSIDDDPEEFANIEIPDIRFGEWSEKEGLKRAPLIASYHYDEIQLIGQRILDAVHQHADHIPFSFNDNFELWLLDKEHKQPLALLDSVCQENEIMAPASLIWKAGIRCRAQFNSTIQPLNDKEEPHADMLDKLINKRAGNSPSAQWFYRTRRGYGQGLKGFNLAQQHIGRELSPRLFPRMFIEQSWEDEHHTTLFNEFIHWLSPVLLLMDFLKDDQRKSFEASARAQALLVDKMYLLYPKVIDEKEIKAARVEAAFRKATTHESTDEPPLAIDYLEITRS